MDMKKKLLAFAENNHIDLIGFADKKRFEGVADYLNPFTIFPEGETVILIGKKICRGSLRGVEEGVNFNDYHLFGSAWLDDEFISLACYDLTRVIEDEGYEAVPIFPNPTEMHGQGISVAEGRAEPNVTPDFNYAAVACGLGEISATGLVFTKKYGPRQRFQMVITDAVIEPSPIYEGSICDRCMKCADVCPLGAISKTEFETITVCGKTMKVAKIDYKICAKCQNGCKANRLFADGKPDIIPALCNRTCIDHLEKEKLIDNVFENKLRQREAWGKDVFGRNVKVREE